MKTVCKSLLEKSDFDFVLHKLIRHPQTMPPSRLRYLVFDKMPPLHLYPSHMTRKPVLSSHKN